MFFEIMRLAVADNVSRATLRAVWREHLRRLRLSESPSRWRVAFHGSDDEVVRKCFLPGEWSREEAEELLEELYVPPCAGMYTESIDAYRVKEGLWVYHKSAYPIP